MGISRQELQRLIHKNSHLLADEDKRTLFGPCRTTNPNAQLRNILSRPSRPQTRTQMNNTEQRFAAELDTLLREGHISQWHFERFALKLAPRTWYCPDFSVLDNHGQLHFIEIKGFLRDDAAVKFKTAAELYPAFAFHMLRPQKKSWKKLYTHLTRPRPKGEVPTLP